MKWEETNTVRDFRTFRNGIYVMTVFHALHDDIFNVIIEAEGKVTLNRQMGEPGILRQYGIELINF